MAVQRAGSTSTSSNVAENRLGKIIFQHNDVLVLHAAEDSPLLEQKREREEAKVEREKVQQETKKSRLAQSNSSPVVFSEAVKGRFERSDMKPPSRSQSKSNLDMSFTNLSDVEGFENTSEFTCGDDLEVLLADAQDLNFSEFAIPCVVAGAL